MEKLAIIALTSGGCRTARRLGRLLPEAEVFLKAGALSAAELAETESGVKINEFREKLAELIARIYGEYQGFIMIMAAGIVFRTFAPYAAHKSVDPAVVVMDERAQFAVSLLSGHLGGANELARRVAAICSASWGQPCRAVITTATDVCQKPAFDLLAQANDCQILNLDELKYISGALVNGRQVGLISRLPLAGEVPPEIIVVPERAEAMPELVLISPYVEEQSQPRHILRLAPQNLILGVGCKRHTPAADLARAAADFLSAQHIEPRALCAIASVDLKKDEPGILALAEAYGLPFITYTAVELQPLASELAAEDKSPFVQSVAGTPSVAQAAALLASRGGRTIIAKTRYPGITFSVAERSQVFKFI